MLRRNYGRTFWNIGQKSLKLYWQNQQVIFVYYLIQFLDYFAVVMLKLWEKSNFVYSLVALVGWLIFVLSARVWYVGIYFLIFFLFIYGITQRKIIFADLSEIKVRFPFISLFPQFFRNCIYQYRYLDKKRQGYYVSRNLVVVIIWLNSSPW